MKKRNKIISIVMLSLLVIGVVSAVLAPYFGNRQTTLNVTLPIEVTGLTEETIDGMGCEKVIGDNITITNLADQETEIKIISEILDEGEGVETSYIGTLGLTQKTVAFETNHWAETGLKATVEYTVAGNSFTAEVTEGAIPGYVLIYYKDNSDRFDVPATAILVENVNQNLPYKLDGNVDEYSYCGVDKEIYEENYKNCHGAKLWYVPSTAIYEDGSLNWSVASTFYFETELIQYNKAGIITIYPLSTLVINPVFDLDCMLVGTVVINTTIENV